MYQVVLNVILYVLFKSGGQICISVVIEPRKAIKVNSNLGEIIIGESRYHNDVSKRYPLHDVGLLFF